MSQYAVLGLGIFGRSLAIALGRAGHQVLAIDSDTQRVDAVRDQVEDAVVADFTDTRALEDLGIKDLDAAFVCVGERLEASVLATLILREAGVPRVVAKAMSDEHSKILTALGAEVIWPERDMAERTAEVFGRRNIIDHLTLGENHSVLEIKAPESWVGRSLTDLGVRQRFGVHVIAIKHHDDGETCIDLVDLADRVVQEADELIVLGSNEDLAKLPRPKEEA